MTKGNMLPDLFGISDVIESDLGRSWQSTTRQLFQRCDTLSWRYKAHRQDWWRIWLQLTHFHKSAVFLWSSITEFQSSLPKRALSTVHWMYNRKNLLWLIYHFNNFSNVSIIYSVPLYRQTTTLRRTLVKMRLCYHLRFQFAMQHLLQALLMLLPHSMEVSSIIFTFIIC